MAVSTSGIISEPVSIYDIQKALGTDGGGDLGTLCKSANINKWTMYKPEGKVSGSGITGNMPRDYLTLAQRKSNYFGLTPQQNTKAKQVAYGYGGTDAHNVGDSGYSVANILAANIEWPYTKPSGNAVSPYRQTDFACDRAKTYGIQGYRHQARSPIFGWSDWDLYKSDLQTAINASLYSQVYNYGSDAGAWKLDPVYSPYNLLSMRLSENSASQINGGGSDMIPLSWLLGGITSENWRIGLGVFVDGETKMYTFVSGYPLRYLTNVSTIMEQGPAFPNIGTNQFLCKKMIAALGSATSKEFTAMPLLVRNCIMTQGQLDYGVQTLVTFSGTNTLMYSVPSDATTIKITLRDETKPTVQGLTTVTNSNTTDGVFILGTYGTGQYAGSGSSASITPVLALGIFLTDNHSFTGTKTLVYDVTYTYGLNGQPRYTINVSGTKSITNSDIITINGVNHVGVQLAVGPSLSVSAFQRLTYQT